MGTQHILYLEATGHPVSEAPLDLAGSGSVYAGVESLEVPRVQAESVAKYQQRDPSVLVPINAAVHALKILAASPCSSTVGLSMFSCLPYGFGEVRARVVAYDRAVCIQNKLPAWSARHHIVGLSGTQAMTSRGVEAWNKHDGLVGEARRATDHTSRITHDNVCCLDPGHAKGEVVGFEPDRLGFVVVHTILLKVTLG